MNQIELRAAIAGALACAAPALRAAEAAAPAASYSPLGNIFQVLLGLAVVLLAMWASARLLKRYAETRQGGAGALRVLGGVAVGQRERVVMIEVGDTWVLVGVAPGRVNPLHVMAKLPQAASPAPALQPGEGFAARLARLTRRTPE